MNNENTIVVRLKKAMYGLKEASMKWYEHLTSVLKEFGFVKSKHDAALMFKQVENGKRHYVLMHVNDIFSVGPRKQLDEFNQFMEGKFKQITLYRVHQMLLMEFMKMRRDNLDIAFGWESKMLQYM